MKPVSNVTVLQQLGWRYATKKFDPTRKIVSEDWKTLEQALLLTPSSYGLQPWKFIIITDPSKRAELRPFTWNQPQVTDCSHYVVFTIRKNIDLGHVQKLIDRTSEVRQIPATSIETYKQMMLSDVVHGPRSLQANEWAARLPAALAALATLVAVYLLAGSVAGGAQSIVLPQAYSSSFSMATVA